MPYDSSNADNMFFLVRDGRRSSLFRYKLVMSIQIGLWIDKDLYANLRIV